MHRQYSKGGCSRCKLRRKKCDEGRPICSGCARWPKWKDTCSYAGQSPGRRSSAVMPKEGSRDLHRALSVRHLRDVHRPSNEIESRVLQAIPESIQALFSPACADHIRDLQTMWQLMMNNHILRNASVACFSRRLDDSPASTKLSLETYCRTLQALRSKILGEDLDHETTICIIASVAFLGKMDLFTLQSDADALEHWVALIPLLAGSQISELAQQGVLPANETTLLFELLFYHVGTIAIFSHATERAWDLWQANGVYQRLCTHNPDDSGRIGRSPLLCGQYQLYDMALRVTFLLRRHPNGHIPASVADELESIVRRQDTRLDDDFSVTAHDTTSIAKRTAECAIYHLFCNSLFICITALRESSHTRRQRMRNLVASGMKMFLALPDYGDVDQLSEHASHFTLAAVWPIQIQGCAAYDLAQFRTFMDHFMILEHYLDQGHRRRAQLLLDQVVANLKKPTSEEVAVSGARIDPEIPTGLKLLRYAIALPLTAEEVDLA